MCCHGVFQLTSACFLASAAALRSCCSSSGSRTGCNRLTGPSLPLALPCRSYMRCYKLKPRAIAHSGANERARRQQRQPHLVSGGCRRRRQCHASEKQRVRFAYSAAEQQNNSCCDGRTANAQRHAQHTSPLVGLQPTASSFSSFSMHRVAGRTASFSKTLFHSVCVGGAGWRAPHATTNQRWVPQHHLCRDCKTS